ncbi:hypothetical protein MJ561_15775 [Klebsiella pneumoniae]|nr:hypothetical protein MJ561_15775 [Klebsiella pneumoniae]
MSPAASPHRPFAWRISKRFSLEQTAPQALDSVSFEVKRGTHALVGESGSGKTTWRRDPAHWALSAPTPDRSPSTVLTPASRPRGTASLRRRSSLSCRTPSLRSTRAERCLRLSKSD